MNAHLKLTQGRRKPDPAFRGLPQERRRAIIIAYKCPANVLTIGWGHTNHHGRKFDATTRWTREECDAAFLEDMEGFEAAVRRLVTGASH